MRLDLVYCKGAAKRDRSSEKMEFYEALSDKIQMKKIRNGTMRRTVGF